MADLLVIVPTRSRPGNARRMLAAWDETDAWADSSLLFVADADDPQIGGYRRLVAEHDGNSKRWRVIEVPRWRPMVPKLNQAAVREAVRCGPTRWLALAFMGDDHLPRTCGWARAVLDTIDDLGGTGIVYGNDLHRGAELATHWVMTTNIVRALGLMVPAPVRHQFCDRAVMDIGRAAGCLRYRGDVIVEHMHYSVGKAAKDHIYEIGNRQRGYEADQHAYEQWLRYGLRRDAARVRALMGRR